MADNPNNCETCDHRKTQQAIEAADPTTMKLHCYHFREPFPEVCMQHTGRKMGFFSVPVNPDWKISDGDFTVSMGANFPIQTSIHQMVEELKRNAPAGAEFD